MANKRPNIREADAVAGFVREALSGVAPWLPVTTQKQLEASLKSLEDLGSVKIDAIPDTLRKAEDALANAGRARSTSSRPAISEEAKKRFEQLAASFEQSVQAAIAEMNRRRRAEALDAGFDALRWWAGQAWNHPVMELTASYLYARNQAAMASAARHLGLSRVEFTRFDLHATLDDLGKQANKLKKPEVQALLLLLGEVPARTKGTKAELVKRLYTNSTRYVEERGTYSR